MADPDREARFARVAARRLPWVRVAMAHVHHRHNTSAVLRTADALGLHHVHLVGLPDFMASRGPARGADRWLELHHHPTTEEAVEAIRAAGCALWVADLAHPPVPPSAVPVDRPVCLWFGAEVVGVDPVARAAADGVVTIPMHGFAQSLNVSVAAALTLHVVAERARTAHGEAALLPPAVRDDLVTGWVAREHEELDAEAARQHALALLAAYDPEDPVR